MSSELKNWQFEGIEIGYYDHLDGDGRAMAESFVTLIKEKYAHRLPFDCCYEWCSGPGFIGFALLAAKLCNRLVLADINPEAVELAKQTVNKNNLGSSVSVYLSDNLSAIPQKEKFDLVVANPPNFYCINPLHPSHNRFIGDLRPNDTEWLIHADFYRNIRKYLHEDAILCIEEVDPYATKCFMPNGGDNDPLWGPEPFDIRPRAPIFDFREMIAHGGLIFDETVILPHSSVPIHVLISHNSELFESSKITIRPGLIFLEQVGELENSSFRLYAMENNQLRGYVDLPDNQLWLVNMVELLLNAADRGMTAQQLSTRLDVLLSDVQSASEMLRNMVWAF